MKVGVIGLGNIAQKAYLPSYMQLQDQADFYFATRNKAVQEHLQKQYGIANMLDDLSDLLTAGIEACFIHTATSSHYQLIKECLENNVHVFVDKPISENVAQVQELLDLAEKKQLILMTGFNRRFAPMVEKLKAIPDKRTLYLSKHRQQATHKTDYVIYDLFLHLVDTAVYLLDDPVIDCQSFLNEKAGLETATVILQTENTTAVLNMDLKSGANTEEYQLTSLSQTATVTNLTKFQQQTDNTVNSEFGDWETTLSKRGFYQMVVSFLEAAANKIPAAQLRQNNVLLSHQLCQKIIEQQKTRQNS